MTAFPIVPSRTGLLFFDTLNVYLHPEDPRARAAVEASGLIPTFVRINEACRAAGIAIFYGQADHRPDYKDFAPQVVDRWYRGLPGEPPRLSVPPPVISGTWGAEVIAEIAPQPGDYVIKKHRWSTFYQTHFELSLRTACIDTIMLAGGSTEIGIASTAYSARDRDFSIIVLKDACVSSKEGVNEFFMERIFPIFARVMTVEQAIAAFE